MALVDQPPLGRPQLDEPGPPGLDAGDGDSGGAGDPWWHQPWKLLVMGAALVFLGVSIGYAAFSRERVPAASSVDVGFLQDMRMHHDQAVAMSLLFREKPSGGQDDALRQIAGEVLLGQQLENGYMVRMLAGWGRSEANESGEAMRWMGMPVAVERMPGLASRDEMKQLQAATGPEADLLFASLLRTHHEGGVHMAGFAAERATTPEVRRLAASMVESQADEIRELDKALARLGGS
jgi:uncharacterized protein (DUF305 family)